MKPGEKKTQLYRLCGEIHGLLNGFQYDLMNGRVSNAWLDEHASDIANRLGDISRRLQECPGVIGGHALDVLLAGKKG